MKPSSYQLIMSPDVEETESLSARWLTADGKAKAEAVRNAVMAGTDIPDEIPLIEGNCNSRVRKLADLRGIDLSGLEIGDVDLAACCFDGANFSGATLNRTSFQYSSFKNVNFRSTKWNAVQASPISADGASFQFAHISSSFFMCSYLVGANFDDAEIKQTDFAGSELGSSKLSNAHSLSNVNITQIFLSDKDEGLALQSNAGVTGKFLVQNELVVSGGDLARLNKSDVAAAGFASLPQTRMASFGSPDALFVVLKWSGTNSGEDPVDRTCEIQLWLRKTLIWGEKDINCERRLENAMKSPI